MEGSRETPKDSVVINELAKGAAGAEQGAAGGVVMLHLGGGFDSGSQTASPTGSPQGEERTHVKDLRESSSPAPDQVVSMGQARPAKSPEEDCHRGRPGLLADGGGGVLLPGKAAVAAPEPPPVIEKEEEDCGRERLKRHRLEMAGRVWIPESWGQEKLLKDWIDCAAIDRALVPRGLLSAREALVEECRRANSGRFRLGNRCLST